MATGEQNDVVEFLSRGESYGRAGETPQRIDTHISIVFLVGDRVYKLKRAVRYSFLDYSQPAVREQFCRAEYELNRRTAPDLYLAVRAITRKSGGGLEWDGAGEALDWVVEMQRFDQRELFDHLATEGRLTPVLMTKLADAIAQFHAEAEITPSFGGSSGIAEVVADNHQYLTGGCPPLDRREVEDLRSASQTALAAVRALLDRRQAAGHVRRCHGDLHLRNICLFHGKPTLFDCIEFSDSLACIDVLFDLAFLLMDLEHRGLRDLANAAFNRYLDRSGEGSGLAALPLFLSVRAAVRAKVAVMSLAVHAQESGTEAKTYLDLARSVLRPSPPRLIAVGGFSGSGKSTVAAGLAPLFGPAPGARLLRSDVLRKSLMKAAPETRLPPSAYTADVNLRVYQAMRQQAAMALAAGYTAIVDATFIDMAQRRDIALLAQEAGVPFAGLWLAAPEEVLVQRVTQRQGDASDADQAVLMRQLTADTGAIEWMTISARGSPAESLAAARQAFETI